MDKSITARELANLLKLGESTIYKLASNGQLPGFKIGDSWRFEMDEILELIRRKGNGQRLEPTDVNLED